MSTSPAIAHRIDARGRQQIVLTMIGGPLLVVAAEAISPINDATDSSTQRVAHIVDNAGRYNVAVVCLLFAMMLFVPAVLGLRRVVLGDRRAGTAGTMFAVAGFMLFAAASGALGVGPTAWADTEVDRTTLVSLFDAMDSGKGVMPIVQWAPILALAGLIALAVALWRHTNHPRWATLALPAGWGAFLFTPTHALRGAGALIMLAAFMPTIVQSPRLETATPTVDGARAVAAASP